jgi:hypothetical protein
MGCSTLQPVTAKILYNCKAAPTSLKGAQLVTIHYMKNSVTALRYLHTTNAVAVPDGYDTLITGSKYEPDVLVHFVI